jgi:hypothetical protein
MDQLPVSYQEMLKQVQHDKGGAFCIGGTGCLQLARDNIPRPEILNQVQDDEEETFHSRGTFYRRIDIPASYQEMLKQVQHDMGWHTLMPLPYDHQSLS